MNNFKEILRKVPGFRSNATWKKVISIIYFLFCLLMLTAEFQMFLFFFTIPFFIFYLISIVKNKKNKSPIKKEVIGAVIAFFLMIGSLSTSSVEPEDSDIAKLEDKSLTPVAKANSNPKENKVKEDKAKEDKAKEDKAKEDKAKEDKARNLEVHLSDIKLAFEQHDMGFTFTDSPLSDGTPRQLGQSQEGKGSGLLELYGKEKLEKAYLGTIAASDSQQHNMFNIIYMSGLLKHVIPQFEDSETWLNESIGKIVEDPETPIVKTINNKTITLSIQELLGMFELTIEPL